MDSFLTTLCKEMLLQHAQWDEVMKFPASIRLSLLVQALRTHDIPLQGYQRKLLTDGVASHYLYAVGLDEVVVIDAMGRNGWDSIAGGYFYWLPEDQKSHGWSMMSNISPSYDHTRIDFKSLDLPSKELFAKILEEQKVFAGARLISHATQAASATKEMRVIRL